MTTSKQRVNTTLSHGEPDRVAVDFGATTVTGLHCKIIAGLREYYGLEKRPVEIIEPFQMLGLVDEELKAIMHVDCEHVFGRYDMFGNDATRTHVQRTPWGQEVIISDNIDFTPDGAGNIWVYPHGDRELAPSAVLPEECYFFNAIERVTEVDDATLTPDDNLEEFGSIAQADLDLFATRVEKAAATGRAVVASFGGAALGDVAMIPGVQLSHPRGIRSVAEWYMSTLMRPDYIREVFDRQIDIAIENHRRLWERVGDKIDVLYVCGTDFGSQDSQFCSPETFDGLWAPYYRRFNEWIHANTTWKVFKHSCGSMVPLLPNLIAAGFDIFNPVQINSRGMDPDMLKERFGDKLVFWGGGVDTQQVLPFGTPEQVARHVEQQVRIFNPGGGFVFNSVHNIQANVPVENVVAMIDTLNRLRNL